MTSGATLSMYHSVMGDAFLRLAPAVRRFHDAPGKQVFAGWSQVDAPRSLMARGLAFCLGAPLTASQGVIHFELDTSAFGEHWTRHFPGKTMTSRLVADGDRIIERLGAARLTFELCEDGGKLVMRLERMHFFGVRCPASLMPRVVAEETGHGDELHFDIHASLPLVGSVTRYRGHLAVPKEHA